MNKKNTLIFLQTFNIANPVPEEQLGFIMCETLSFGEYRELGKVYDNNKLYEKNLREFIPDEVNRLRPEWIVAEAESATIALHLKRQKKVLINPQVTFEDLNNVSDYDRRHTWAFFDLYHEKDYNKFQSVYPNSGWYPDAEHLNLLMLKDLIVEIIT